MDSFESYRQEVRSKLEGANREVSERILRRSLSIEPRDQDSWTRLGKLVGIRGLAETAIRFHVRSMLCPPGSVRARDRLIMLFRSEPALAVGYTIPLLRDLLGSGDAGVLAACAMVLIEQGDLAAAGQLLRQAAVRDPGLGGVWTGLALAWASEDGAARAKRLWRRAWIGDSGAFEQRYHWAERIAVRAGTSAALYPLLAHAAEHRGGNAADRAAMIGFVAARRHPPAPPRPARRAKIDHPLILISQIQRSGGSMLLECLDDHPEIFAYPYELILGRPRKAEWPDLDLSDPPARWLRELYEPRLATFIMQGFAKPDLNRFARQARLPFGFDITTLVDRFLDAAPTVPPRDQRSVMDRYFMAYFDAWTDHRASGRERWIAAFAPRLAMLPLSLQRYRRDYPDGHLVGLIRHPRSWLISAQRHSKVYHYLDTALTLWQISTESIMEQAARYPGRTTAMIYESLVSDPEPEMRRLAAALGIEYRSSLLVPTLRGQPLLPNSSFDIDRTGIHRDSLARDLPLPDATEAILAATAVPLYEEARRIVCAGRAPVTREDPGPP